MCYLYTFVALIEYIYLCFLIIPSCLCYYNNSIIIYKVYFADEHSFHDDILTWKHFPHHWPFMKQAHRWRVPPTFHKGSGMGVTKLISSVPLFFEVFSIAKTHVVYGISRLYLTGVVAAQPRWHLSNSNVIQRYCFQIEYFAYGEINEGNFCEHNPCNVNCRWFETLSHSYDATVIFPQSYYLETLITFHRLIFHMLKQSQETFCLSSMVPNAMKIFLFLTHWGRVMHICVGNLTIIGSDNGLSPGRRQAIIWTNAGILLIGPLATNFSEILIGIQTFSIKKMHSKMSSGK